MIGIAATWGARTGLLPLGFMPWWRLECMHVPLEICRGWIIQTSGTAWVQRLWVHIGARAVSKYVGGWGSSNMTVTSLVPAPL